MENKEKENIEAPNLDLLFVRQSDADQYWMLP